VSIHKWLEANYAPLIAYGEQLSRELTFVCTDVENQIDSEVLESLQKPKGGVNAWRKTANVNAQFSDTVFYKSIYNFNHCITFRRLIHCEINVQNCLRMQIKNVYLRLIAYIARLHELTTLRNGLGLLALISPDRMLASWTLLN